jgi:general secretion pathway protein J
MNGQSNNKSISSKGFTLVEILIAILILGIVLSTVYAAYTSTMKNVRDIEYQNNLYKMARTALDRMIKDLSSLQQYSDSSQQNSGSFDLRAEKQALGKKEFYSLSFLSAAHLAFGENEGDGSPATISYYVEEDEGGGSFSLRRADLAGGKPSKEKNISGGYVVCHNVDSFRLRFYDAANKELEFWDSSSYSANQQGRPPVAVKIELALVNLNNKETPYRFMTKVFLPVNKQTP